MSRYLIEANYTPEGLKGVLAGIVDPDPCADGDLRIGNLAMLFEPDALAFEILAIEASIDQQCGAKLAGP